MRRSAIRGRIAPGQVSFVSPKLVVLAVLFALLVSSCVRPDTPSGPTDAGVVPVITPPPITLSSPTDTFDPVKAGEVVPPGFRQVLDRDDIAPIYNPAFVRASDVDWPAGSLVIGVDIDGEARAYPVGFLTRREIVNDLHRGIPTLVTW